MSDKCQHCTEMQVRIDLNMYIAWLEAELEAMTTERNVAVSNIGKRGRRVVELEAVEERLLKQVAELEAELAKLKAENQWHPASEPPDHDRQIMIASAGGCHIWHGNRYNLIPSDLWREIPKPPREGGQ